MANSIWNHGTKAAIMSLTSDGDNVYGTGYVFGALSDGNLEGTFNAKWSDGSINWIEDCHGDTYSSAPMDGVLYTASHAHDCANVPGGFDQAVADNSATTKQRALAFSLPATGTLLHNTYGGSGYADFGGTPAPTMLPWYPDLTAGTFTGQAQAAWSVAAGSGYVLLGGEFPSVNGARQTGLVRFAVSSKAPNAEGPRLRGSAWAPTAVSLGSGSVRVGWLADYDRDDASLTYTVSRGGTVVGRTTAISRGWWYRPSLSITDTGLTPGSTATYTVTATDSDGNTATSAPVSTVVSGTSIGGTAGAYSRAVLADAPADYWRFDERSGSTVYDRSASSDLTAGAGVTLGAAGAITGDTDTAASFSGAAGAFAATATQIDAPNTFSLESWFKTTSTSGGKIMGFGSANTGDSSSYDRHVYMDSSGRVLFGVYPNASQTIQSAAGYNDGKWHQVAATLSSAGMQLFIDGKSVAKRADVTQGQSYRGYWRVGGDNSWSGAPYFTGTIDDVSVYGTALSDAQVANHYAAATVGTSNTAPTAKAAVAADGLVVTVDGSASTDADGKVAAYRWDFGDGTSAATATATHTYDAAGTYAVKLTVTDDGGLTDSVIRSTTVKAPNAAPSASFTAAADAATVSVDASGSKDPDGTIASYAWDFGDGGTATGASTKHTYAKSGSYDVALVVTDDAGASDRSTKTVQVTVPAVAAPLARDAFGRSVAAGLGTADLGGAWSIASADTAQFSVVSGAARVSDRAGTTLSAYLTGNPSTDTDLTASLTPSILPTGGSAYGGLLVRRQGGDDYGARLVVGSTGSVNVEVLKDGTALKGVTVAGLKEVAGGTLRLRVQASGTNPTQLSAKVWKDGSSEPTSWQVSAADSTAALQSSGGVGIRTYTGGAVSNGPVVWNVDDLVATTIGSTPAAPGNAAPKAAFTSNVDGLDVALDGGASTDSDGTVAKYAWDFGDGATGTGAKTTHTYAAAGTYSVKLAVTDDGGATDSTSSAVVVKAPAPTNAAPKASFTSIVDGLSVSVDGSGSSDSDGTVAKYAWDFGDGATSSDAKASHAYAAAGSYAVKLLITDDGGATDSVTRSVVVAAPAPADAVLAKDAFGRDAAKSLGTADIGGSWTVPSESGSFAVSQGHAVLSGRPGITLNAYLGALSSSSTDTTATITPSSLPTGGTLFAGLTGRRVGNDDYSGRVNVSPAGAITVEILRSGVSLKSATLKGVTATAGTGIHLRLQVTGTGTTTIQARAWLDGTAEPTGWAVSTTDTTAALQSAGSVGIRTYTGSGVTNAPLAAWFDDLVVTELR
ncbi:PKD domain-containing protein [Amnibacterium soli]|uniref:PKD domain-containing protein n=1 Tax=Amnibacterium soli TaxID=1282736 RepID=UPI0031E65EF7